MNRWLLLVASVLLAAAGPLAADLDVTVPPGLPPEWVRCLPKPPLTDLGRIPAARPTSRQGSVERTPRRRPPLRFDGQSSSTFGFAGITTLDLPQHFTWATPTPSSSKPPAYRPLTGPGAVGPPPDWKFPPPPPAHLFWLALASMLRGAIHPALVNRTATIEYLVLLGEPAYLAAEAARMEVGTRPIAKQLMKYIGKPTTTYPMPSGGKTPYQQMIHRLALVELASGYPYGPQRRFARRLMSLGGEGLPALLHYSKDPHQLVRRNAVALLGRYTSPKAVARLRALFGDPDRVVRNRALQSLTDRRDKAIVPALIGALQSPDAGLRVQAAMALGLIGDRRGLTPLVQFVQRHGKDPDALGAALPGIGRLASRTDTAVLKLLETLEANLRGKRVFGRTTPVFPPPMPDCWSTEEVLAQACLLARAGMGSARARGRVIALIKAGKRRWLSKRVRTIYKVLRRRGKVLSQLAPSNQFFACEMLRRMGAQGNALLVDVICDDGEETPVRAHALRFLEGAAAWTFLEIPGRLTRLIRDSDSALIRMRALLRLEKIDAQLAVNLAREIVAKYGQGKADYKKMGDNWVVIPAMRLLGRYAATNISQLKAVVHRAALEQQAARQRIKKIKARARIVSPGSLESISIPPVLQTALLELGRTGRRAAEALLLSRLANTDEPGRGAAVLGLGAIGGKTIIARLVGALADGDPWVRFCAYRSLRRVTRADFFCDWFFASKPQLVQTIDRWKNWWRETYDR